MSVMGAPLGDTDFSIDVQEDVMAIDAEPNDDQTNNEHQSTADENNSSESDSSAAGNAQQPEGDAGGASPEDAQLRMFLDNQARALNVPASMVMGKSNQEVMAAIEMAQRFRPPAEQRQDGQANDQQNQEELTFGKFDMTKATEGMELEDEVSGLLNQINDHYGQQLEQLHQSLSGFTSSFEQQQAAQDLAAITGYFDKAKLQEFGEGYVQPGTVQYRNREQLMMAMDQIDAVMAEQGHPRLPMDQLIERAIAFAFPQVQQQQTRRGVTDQLRDPVTGQFTSKNGTRPTGSQPTSKDPVKNAESAVEAKLREFDRR